MCAIYAFWRNDSILGIAGKLLIEWLYLLHSAKLCAAHNVQSGIPSSAKDFCAFVALLAVQLVHLCIVLYHNIRHQKHYF
jgi:hypothetical protein